MGEGTCLIGVPYLVNRKLKSFLKEKYYNFTSGEPNVNINMQFFIPVLQGFDFEQSMNMGSNSLTSSQNPLATVLDSVHPTIID